MEAVALYTFRATENDELSFNKGDMMKGGSVFFCGIAVAPQGCASFAVCITATQRVHLASLWFAGRVSRGVAEGRLRPRECGAFLVRESESAPGEFSMSVSYGDHVQHFKVLQDRGGQYFVWDELFCSLNELVDFYHTNSIAKERTRPHHAHALFDFAPQQASQLPFLRGDLVDLLDCSDPQRWKGRCHGRVGHFPPEYVQPVYHCQ
ncbi:hypothetical protein CRUP_014721 [Coryphaenoides rupestris]|nr:hypothetical protein CRUP_014721 [Coryphaenoides rupestris]